MPTNNTYSITSTGFFLRCFVVSNGIKSTCMSLASVLFAKAIQSRADVRLCHCRNINPSRRGPRKQNGSLDFLLPISEKDWNGGKKQCVSNDVFVVLFLFLIAAAAAAVGIGSTGGTNEKKDC